MVLCNPDEDDGTEGSTIIVCAGPPQCEKLDPTPYTMDTCPYCKRVYVAADGSMAVMSEPGHA